MGKLAKTLPVGAKKAAWGDKQQQQQPQASQPVRPLQPSAAPTGKLTRAEKKRKRREEHLQQVRAGYLAELASKGVLIPPDMMQPEKPARTLTPGQQLRKQELCAALVESKGSLKTLRAIKRGLTKALGDFEQKLREQEDLHDEIITELKTLS